MNGVDSIRIMCVDDHQIVLEGLSQVLSLEEGFEVVATATNGRDALQALRDRSPDVVLMDLRLREESGHSLTQKFLQEAPECRVLILSSLEGDADIERALAVGARGYVMKGCSREELTRAIRTVHAGKRYLQTEVATALAEHLSTEALTEREQQVLSQMARGLRNRDIGVALHIAEDTVKMHVKNIFAKLGATDRTEAVTIALRRGLAHL